MKIDENLAFPRYAKSLDFDALEKEYPPPPEFFRTVYRMPRHELRALQEKRFLKLVARGWEIPFFRKRWKAAGLESGDIRSLEDIVKIPPYTVHDTRKSIEEHPPFGDFMGIPVGGENPLPLVLHTSGGTTGMPRPMLYTPQDRETMAILGARRYAMQGMRPGDKVLAALSLGLSNGGFALRDTIWKYIGAIPVMTGGGNTTATRRQVEIMKTWGIDIICSFPAYLRHLAIVARDELKLDPRSLGVRALHSHIGIEDRGKIEALWNAPCYDMYGTNESGMMACECVQQTGMHIQEDAVILEVADVETGKLLPEGEKGTVYITTLYRWGAPSIRFNVNDISALMPAGCACGSTLRRLDKIFGRNDNMVKLRGANVFPEAVGVAVAEDARANGEFFCIVERVGEEQRDEMTVMVELLDLQADAQAVKESLERRLKEVTGVRLTVSPVARGTLDPYTGTSQTSKIKRLLDKRK
ncbi:MAG: phenylacetate--CoA ligase family protein [Betaproteobacteria bacterium]|nr:phenylacetate--CoA ligase family protein [Betaproteobacteria bacterium]